MEIHTRWINKVPTTTTAASATAAATTTATTTTTTTTTTTFVIGVAVGPEAVKYDIIDP